MAEFHVRGGLGTQILSLYACYAIAIENNLTIDRLIFNHGFYPPEIAKLKDANVIFVDNILEFRNKPEYVTINGTNKTSPFTPTNVGLIIKHWDAIQKEIFLKKKYEQTNEHILHIRQKDRALVLLDRFDSLVYSDNNYTIISDDAAVYQRYNIKAADDTIDDWERIISAKSVTGGYSTFTLLAGMLNPNLKLYIVRKENSVSHLLSDSDWNAVDRYVNAFSNIEWVSL
jgi:hypothetical protein